MGLELATLSKGLAATRVVADVRLLAGVDALVGGQWFLAREDALAYVATDWAVRRRTSHDKVVDLLGPRPASFQLAARTRSLPITTDK